MALKFSGNVPGGWVACIRPGNVLANAGNLAHEAENIVTFLLINSLLSPNNNHLH